MKHFTLADLTRSGTAKRRGLSNQPGERETACLINLVDNILDPLQEEWGDKIHIESAYRAPAVNAAVGGAKSSQHMLGQAADIQTTPKNLDAQWMMLHFIIDLGLPFDQLISEKPDGMGRPNWIHVSYGPRHRRQRLSYNGSSYPKGFKLLSSLFELGICRGSLT